MRDQHIDPEESVRIFQMCGARMAMAHHWGTFQLTDEAIDEPPRALREALRSSGVAEERFRVCRPGEVLDVE
jgi:L-ascorbate metabolism protein UlaG (beta-lactamase superfamily)